MILDKRLAIKFVLLVVLLCAFVSGDAKVICKGREREALLSFKNGLIDEDGILSSWQSNECCEWHGVECSNTTGHVITLDLQCNLCTLQGEVRSSLLELHHLNYLDLSQNNFGGIPIPEFFYSMKQLQHLLLSFSNFSTTIPPQLGNLTNLRSLDLSGNGIRNIPPQLWNLTNLRSLNLAYNSLNSESLSIPGSVLESLEILNLAENQLNGLMLDLRAFPSLTNLYLMGNNFTGSIPVSIGQLSKLQDLYLESNSLEGLVSESHFIKLNKLKRLDLSFNSLIMNIAPDWNPPFQLSTLSLAGCNVGPYFPNWLRTQRNLAYLDLRGANIQDEVPKWLWNTSSVKYLYLSDNQISGMIPNLSSASILSMDLSNNQLSGPIPLFPSEVSRILLSGNMLSGSISSICNTSSHYYLEYLDLSDNQLEGEVPDCWEKMWQLHSLIFSNNRFSGEIPGSFGNLNNFVALQMHGNNLSSELPYNLSVCNSLRIIDVGDNKLTGEIPTWIGQLYDTQVLNLRGNKLHGKIPLEICNLTNIQVLDLSINNLSGTIHDCFNNFTFLASENVSRLSSVYFLTPYAIIENKPYEYSSFQWKGKESEYRENLRLLKLIDFSSNRLTGNIPKSFSSMSHLYSLNLSRNSLTGHIIPDIGKMKTLDSLDLSYNQLSGKIPTSMAEIHTLGVLDLSNNKLSGKIPTSTQLQSFNASSYAGNDGLCGDPLQKCTERPSTTNPVENMNEKDGNNFSFMQEVAISMAFGFIFGFWGVIGTFILKKSWRIAFFNLFDAAGDWFYVRIAVFVSKWRRS